MTWINSPIVEQQLWNIFASVEQDFKQDLKSDIDSNEERLTGMLVTHLRHWGPHYSKKTQQMVSLGSGWYMRMDYEDMSKKRKEAEFGADMAFILDVKVKGVLKREKAILVQSKKSNTRSCPFDEDQAKDLLDTTGAGYYFIYLHPNIGIGMWSHLYAYPSIHPSSSMFYQFGCILPIPAGQALGLKRASGFETVIPLRMVAPCAKSFPNFMLYDFIGCWAGEDFDGKLKRVVYGESERYIPRHIIKIGIYTEQ